MTWVAGEAGAVDELAEGRHTRRDIMMLPRLRSVSGRPRRRQIHLRWEDIRHENADLHRRARRGAADDAFGLRRLAVGKACAADIKAQCADVKPGGGALKDCVKAHFSDLSADCQVAIVRAAAVGKACKADVKQLCADVKPGKGAIADCMKEHAADVSDGCKDAMAKAEAGAK